MRFIKYIKIFNKKWVYFSLGVFITLIVAGSLTYIARNVKGESFIKSTQTANEWDPAFVADGRGHIYGGLTTNQMSATSGLIVLGGNRDYPPYPPYGRVGIGFPSGEIPSEMLEVRGNVKVTTTTDNYGGMISSLRAYIPQMVSNQVQFGSSLRVNPDSIEHLEERTTGAIYYWKYGNCSCLEARSNQSRLAGADRFSLSSFWNSLTDYLGSLVLPSAWAESSICYNSRQICISKGGEYCFDYGDSCSPGRYDFDIICTPDPTADAQCDPGDSPVAGTEDYNSCYGTQYLGKVQCKKTVTGTAWYPKILFQGSSVPGQLSQTIIDDNLVADNNELSNCSWTWTNECPSGKFMAGYNSSNDEIYCCNL